MESRILSMDTLVQRMAGHDTLQNFHVLVSYRESLVNSWLEDHHATFFKDCLIHDFQQQYTDDNDGQAKTRPVHIELANPRLSFDEVNGQLVFDVTGTHGNMKTPYPKGTVLTLTCPLVSIEGQVTAANNNAATEVKQFTGTPFSAPSDANKRSMTGVSLDFSKGFARVTGEAGSEDVSNYVLLLFNQKAASKFYIAAVAGTSNVSDPNALKPNAFHFTVVKTDESSQAKKKLGATLCMWIGVEGQPAVPKSPQVDFKPDSEHAICSPIPEGKSASIIFSHQLITQRLLTLNNINDISGHSLFGMTSDKGISYLFNLPSVNVTVPESTKHDGQNDYITIPQFSFNLNQGQALLAMDGNVGSTPKIIWGSPEIKTSWYGYRTGGHHPTGEVKLWFATSFDGRWTVSADNKINLNFDKDTLKQLTLSKVEAVETGWLDKLMEHPGDVPIQYKEIKAPAVNIDITLHPLNYFLTTNLLFPGTTFFVPDQPSQGLATPRDLILTGQTTNVPTTTLMSAAPSLMVSNTRVTNGTSPKTASDFVDQMLDPNDKLFSSLVYTKLKNGKIEEYKSQWSDILSKNGYGGLEFTDLAPLLGISESVPSFLRSGSVQPAQPSNSSTLFTDFAMFTNSTIPATFLRAFAGKYKVDNFPDQPLIMAPENGNIIWQGVKTTPSVTINPDDSNLVEFTVKDISYKVSFTSTYSSSTWGAHFVQTTGATELSGTLVQDQPATESQAYHILDGTGFAMGVVLGIGGLLFSIWTYCRGKKAATNSDNEIELTIKDKTDEIITDMHELHKKILETYEGGFKIMAKVDAGRAMKDFNWEELKTSFNTEVEQSFEAEFKNSTLAEMDAIKAGDGTDQKREKLKQSLEKLARAHIQKEVINRKKAACAKRIAKYKASGWLPDSDAEKKLIEDALDYYVDDKMDQLKDDSDGPSLVDSIVDHKILTKRESLRDAEIQATIKSINDHNTDISDAIADINTQTELKDAEEKRLKELKKDASDYKTKEHDLQESIKKIKEAIDKKSKAKDASDSKKATEEANKTAMESEQDADRAEATKAEGEKKSSADRAFKKRMVEA